jgi:nicotinamidase/pyrazinamidase
MAALLLMDLQNDFLPGGALAVARANELISIANHLAPQYALVVATQDWHPANHISFASQHPGHQVGERIIIDGREQILWPDHCIQNTPGAALAAELDTSRIERVFHKGTDPNIDSYSAFFDNSHQRSTGLAEFLHERGASEVHVMGLATDYCVKFTVLDALTLGFRVVVLGEGIRGVELQPGDCQRALDAMWAAGAEIQGTTATAGVS